MVSPVTPADGAQAEELVALAGEILLRHGFEPAISLTMITERSLACVISIAYDRQIVGEDGRATACHEELLRRLADAGYPSYRMTSQSSAGLKPSLGYDSVLRSLKRSLDPNQILAPDVISQRSNFSPDVLPTRYIGILEATKIKIYGPAQSHATSDRYQPRARAASTPRRVEWPPT